MFLLRCINPNMRRFGGDLLRTSCEEPFIGFQLGFKHIKFMTHNLGFSFLYSERTYIARCVGKLDQCGWIFQRWIVRMIHINSRRG